MSWTDPIVLADGGHFPKTKPYAGVPGAVVNGTIGAASVRLAIPANCNFLRCASTGDCHVAFGDGTVVATSADMLFPTGAEVFGIPADATHVAFIRNGVATGDFSIAALI